MDKPHLVYCKRCVRSPPPPLTRRINVFVSNAGEEEVTMVTNNFCVTHRMRMPYAQLGSVGVLQSAGKSAGPSGGFGGTI